MHVLGCSNKKVFDGFATSKVVEAGEVIETAGVPDARKISNCSLCKVQVAFSF